MIKNTLIAAAAAALLAGCATQVPCGDACNPCCAPKCAPCAPSCKGVCEPRVKCDPCNTCR